MNNLIPANAVRIEANHGRWVARCPRPWCTNAIALNPGDTQFECAAADGCGQVADVIWPPDPAAIEALLLMRPVPATRNWLPGETLADLIAENAAHGVFSRALADLTGSITLAAIVDERLVGGLLHQELTTSAARPRIGA